MRLPVCLVFNRPIGELANLIGMDYLAISQMQIRWLGWVLNFEGVHESNFSLRGDSIQENWLCAPLANCSRDGSYEERVTGNILHFGNAAIYCENHLEADFAFNMR